MTLLSEVEKDSKYIKVLDFGFVGLVDIMGNDSSIVQAARVSYGSGTKTVREDRGLVRYLLRHKHTTPFEMVEVKYHIKLPIFVFRQMVRHRTASVNEYSGRYSIMTDEFYIPEAENIQAQSKDNKQGRAGPVSVAEASLVQNAMRDSSNSAYTLYEQLLGGEGFEEVDEHFQGIARESARTVLPLSNYTELYWKQDLKNLFHLFHLRMDEHAQWEIREFANAMYSLIKPLVPAACEAFEDYYQHSLTLSRMERNLLMNLIHSSHTESSVSEYFNSCVENSGSKKAFAMEWGMSERELIDFCKNWEL